MEKNSEDVPRVLVGERRFYVGRATKGAYGTRGTMQNWFSGPHDQRWEGLLKIANAIQTTYHVTSGSLEAIEESERAPDSYPVVTPLRLASLLREAAERIEAKTERAP